MGDVHLAIVVATLEVVVVRPSHWLVLRGIEPVAEIVERVAGASRAPVREQNGRIAVGLLMGIGKAIRAGVIGEIVEAKPRLREEGEPRAGFVAEARACSS